MLNRANSEPVVPIVVVLRIDTTRVEVQVVGIPSRVERCRPVVAVRAAIVPRRAIAVARASEEKQITVILRLQVDTYDTIDRNTLVSRAGIYDGSTVSLYEVTVVEQLLELCSCRHTPRTTEVSTGSILRRCHAGSELAARSLAVDRIGFVAVLCFVL